MAGFHAPLAVIAVALLVIGLLSKPLNRSVFQEPLLVVAIGVAFGPLWLNVIDLGAWGDTSTILKHAAEITLAISLMGIALRIDRRSLATIVKPVTLLLAFGMLAMWLATAGLAWFVLGVAPMVSLLVGAILTPTDPVVATSVVSGPTAERFLPQYLRDMISMESGANDGAAAPFVMLPLVLLTASAPGLWNDWLLPHVIRGVGGAVLLGAAIGFVCAFLLNLAKRYDAIEIGSLLGYTLTFSLMTLALAEILHFNGLFAVFIAGFVFNLRTDIETEHEEENIQEAVAKLFTLPMFVLFGASLPVTGWVSLGWALIAFVVAVLLFRRAPWIVPLLAGIKGRLSREDRLFTGWFGPIGIAAIYYAMIAWERTGDDAYWAITSAVVLASICAHGMSATPLTHAYDRRTGNRSQFQRGTSAGTETSGAH